MYQSSIRALGPAQHTDAFDLCVMSGVACGIGNEEVESSNS